MRRYLPGILAMMLLAGWFLPGSAHAQVSISAYVDDNVVGADEEVTLTIEIRGVSFSDVLAPEAPATEGLAIQHSLPHTGRNVSIVNGRMQQMITYRWRFRPLGEGSARIGSVRVSVGNDTYETDGIDLTIVPQSRQQAARGANRPASPDSHGDEEESAGISERDIFVEAVPSKNVVYRNEQLVIDYILYVADEIQLRDSRAIGPWELDGFWRENMELPARQTPVQEVINGRRFNVIPVRRAAFFPTRTGSLTIKPFQIRTEASVHFTGRSYGGFSRSFRGRYEPVTLATPPVNVQVRDQPSPPDGSYSGAVGRFSLDASVDRNAIETGESVVITVEISGTGNLATLSVPDLNLLTGADIYAPDISTDIERTGSEIRGTKRAFFTVIPTEPGDLRIPPVELLYFDPGSATYRMAQTEELNVQVSGSPIASSSSPADPLNDIMLEPVGQRREDAPLFGSFWVFAGLAGPLLLLGCLTAFKLRRDRRQAQAAEFRSRRAHPVARKHLREAENLLRQNDARSFYAEISRALLSFIGNRLNVSENGMTRDTMQRKLRNAGVPEETREQLIGLLDECDRARFAPVAPAYNEMETATERAARIITAVDSALHERQAAQPAA